MSSTKAIVPFVVGGFHAAKLSTAGTGTGRYLGDETLLVETAVAAYVLRTDRRAPPCMILWHPQS